MEDSQTPLPRKDIKKLMDVLSPFYKKMWLIDYQDMTEAEIAEAFREMDEYAEKERLRELGIDPDSKESAE